MPGERLDVLEQRVRALIDKCKVLARQRAALESERQHLRSRLEVLESELATLRHTQQSADAAVGELEQMKAERGLIRSKIEHILDALEAEQDELEVPPPEETKGELF